MKHRLYKVAKWKNYLDFVSILCNCFRRRFLPQRTGEQLFYSSFEQELDAGLADRNSPFSANMFKTEQRLTY